MQARGWRCEVNLAFPVSVVIAHVARVYPMKDHESFLTAMSELPEMRALLIGPDTENLPKSRMCRRPPRQILRGVLAAADIVVSRSAFGEGFPTRSARLACGLPAVATDVGDAALIVSDAGLIVPPGDPEALAAAIRQLVREEASARAQRATLDHSRPGRCSECNRPWCALQKSTHRCRAAVPAWKWHGTVGKNATWRGTSEERASVGERGTECGRACDLATSRFFPVISDHTFSPASLRRRPCGRTKRCR